MSLNLPIRCECGLMLPRRAVWALIVDGEVVSVSSSQEEATRQHKNWTTRGYPGAEIIIFNDTLYLKKQTRNDYVLVVDESKHV